MFSWFKKKKEAPKPRVDLVHLPALNEWGQFFQGNGYSLSSRWAGGIPGSESETIFLKAFPDVTELERATFADWLHISEKGIYLQQLSSVTEQGSSLLFLDFETWNATVLKTNITATKWSSGYQEGNPVLFMGEEIFNI